MSALRLYIHDRHGREISGFLTVQRSRRNRACEGHRHTGLHIMAGEHYAMQTVFPSDEFFNWLDAETLRPSRSAVRYRFCITCAGDAARELLEAHLVGSATKPALRSAAGKRAQQKRNRQSPYGKAIRAETNERVANGGEWGDD